MSSNIKIISGKFKGTYLYSPESILTRPTTSRVTENLFNILSHLQLSNMKFSYERKYVLDLCAGSGRLGFEAISRGSEYCLFIDNNKKSRSAILKNINKLSLKEMANFILKDVTKLELHNNPSKFDLIFCDAPYNTDIPNIAIENAYSKGFIGKNSLIIIENSKNNKGMEFDFTEKICEKIYGDTKIQIFTICV